MCVKEKEGKGMTCVRAYFHCGCRVTDLKYCIIHCDSPADRGRGSVERERDKQASGADTTPTKQPLQGSILMHPVSIIPLVLSPSPQSQLTCHLLQTHSMLVRLV